MRLLFGHLILYPYIFTMIVWVLGLPKQRFLSTSDPRLSGCFLESSDCTVKGVGIIGVQGAVFYCGGLIITCIESLGCLARCASARL